jgi:hypothetical protein
VASGFPVPPPPPPVVWGHYGRAHPRSEASPAEALGLQPAMATSVGDDGGRPPAGAAPSTFLREVASVFFTFQCRTSHEFHHLVHETHRTLEVLCFLLLFS